MKRQSIMDTYKEIKAAYSDSFESTKEDKAYLVGRNEEGVIVVSLNFRDVRGLSEVETVVAANSEQARVRYNAVLAANDEGQKYAESFHP
jgi:hypothetical protein